MNDETIKDSELAVPVPVDVGTIGGTICAVCLTEIAGHEEACRCPACQSSAHRACWDEIGGCPTYGCEFMAISAADGDSGTEAGWGDQKDCPRCHKPIKAAALKCRFCKTTFPSAVPMSEQVFLEWERQQADTKPMRTAAVVLFVASLLGFLAPLLVLVGVPWALYRRAGLTRAGGTYVVLTWFGLGLSVLYTFLMIVALL